MLKIDLGGECEASRQCLDANAQCVRGRCQCGDDYFVRDDRCGRNTSCLFYFIVGDSSKSHLRSVIFDGVTERKIDIGASCGVTDVCIDVSAQCVSSLCVCVIGYYVKQGRCCESRAGYVM